MSETTEKSTARLDAERAAKAVLLESGYAIAVPEELQSRMAEVILRETRLDRLRAEAEQYRLADQRACNWFVENGEGDSLTRTIPGDMATDHLIERANILTNALRSFHADSQFLQKIHDRLTEILPDYKGCPSPDDWCISAINELHQSNRSHSRSLVELEEIGARVGLFTIRRLWHVDTREQWQISIATECRDIEAKGETVAEVIHAARRALE